MSLFAYFLFFKFKHVYVLSQQAEEDNEQRKRQEQILMEKLLEQEAMLGEDQKVSVYLCMSTQLNAAGCSGSPGSRR